MDPKIDPSPYQVAVQFGEALDRDDFPAAGRLLSADCQYLIGEEVLTGPEAICGSYENNMIEGRKKLDELQWGKSRVEETGGPEFIVHFTDHLAHKGMAHTHRCRQRLTIREGKIVRIEHCDDMEEQIRLKEFYRAVGIG